MYRFAFIGLLFLSAAVPTVGAQGFFGPVPRLSDSVFGSVPSVDEILSSPRRSSTGNRSIFGPIPRVTEGFRSMDLRLPRRGGYDFNRPLGRTTASVLGPVPRLTERGFSVE